MYLNRQELWLGFLATITLYFKIGLWVIPLAILCSILWALGGAYEKIIRRLGVPVAVCLVSFMLYKSYLIWFSMPFGYAILTIGDGYPDSSDKGSWLGRQVAKCIKDATIGGFVTKLIPVILLQIAWLPIFLS